jgi:MFS family permease
VVIAHAFVQGEASLYAVRFLLGVAVPGLLLYLTLWLPARERGLVFGTLLSTTAIAYAVGAPFTTWLMTFSVPGLKGWQTMYAVQGILTVGIGVSALFLLPSYVKDAAWLTAEEKAWLQQQFDNEEKRKKAVGATTVLQGFFDRRVLMTALTCFFLLCVNFGTVLFLPQILTPAFPEFTNVQISLLITVAFAIGGVAGIVWGRHSDQTGDRKWHMAAGVGLAAVCYAYAAFAPTPILQFAGICVAVLGIWSMFGVSRRHQAVAEGVQDTPPLRTGALDVLAQHVPGLNIRHAAFAQVFGARDFTAHLIGQRRLYACSAMRCQGDGGSP